MADRLAEIQATEADARSQNRLEYLMKQTDVFTHFMTGGETIGSKKGKKGKKALGSPAGRRGGGRMTEDQEDAMMMKAAQKERTFTRLEQQPSIIEFGTTPCASSY